jgi:hypothetical protein
MTPGTGRPVLRRPAAHRRGQRVRDLPFDEEGLGEDVSEEAEAGDDTGDAEVGRLVCDELDLDDVARLGPFDEHGACQRMPEIEVERKQVGVGALARQLVVDAVARLERDLLTRLHGGDRFEIGVPPGCEPGRRDSHRSPPLPAQFALRPRCSSADHARAPSLVRRDDRLQRAASEDRRHDLRREPA